MDMVVLALWLEVEQVSMEMVAQPFKVMAILMVLVDLELHHFLEVRLQVE